MITIQLGYGNALSATFTASAKTLAISGLINSDVSIDSIKSIYSTTRSAYFSFVGATIASSISTGVPIYTITFETIPALSADGDTLIILLEVPDNIALYNAMTYIGVNTIPA